MNIKLLFPMILMEISIRKNGILKTKFLQQKEFLTQMAICGNL